MLLHFNTAADLANFHVVTETATCNTMTLCLDVLLGPQPAKVTTQLNDCALLQPEVHCGGHGTEGHSFVQPTCLNSVLCSAGLLCMKSTHSWRMSPALYSCRCRMPAMRAALYSLCCTLGNKLGPG